MCNTLTFLHFIHILPCVKIRKCSEFKADGIMQMIDTKSKGFCKSNHEFAKSSAPLALLNKLTYIGGDTTVNY